MLGFHDWMLKIKNIHYANDNLMAKAINRLNNEVDQKKKTSELKVISKN